MLPPDLEIRASEHIIALRREADTHRHRQHLTWKHSIATLLRSLADRLEPHMTSLKPTQPTR